MAIEDIATGTFAYQRALDEGLDTQIDFEDSSLRGAPDALARLALNQSRTAQG